MKRILSLTLALALMAAVFTGCGCEANVSTHPNGMITEDTTVPSVMPRPTATHATEPRETTLPHATDAADNGTGANGSSPDAEGNTTGSTMAPGASSAPTETTMPARSRGKDRDSAR